MTKTIKWAILGPGGIAKKFASDLKFVEGAELYAIGSRSLERAKQFASEFNCPKAYGSYHELVQDSEIDIVYVATPHSFHHEHTILCLKNNIAVLCEKAFAINLAEVNDMIATAKEKNVFLMEAFWTPFQPAHCKAKEIVESGELGKITSLHSVFGFNKGYDAYSRLFNKELGGGSLLDIGIYAIFDALYFIGQPDTIQSNATLAPTGVDTTMNIIFGYNHGPSAMLHSSFAHKSGVECTLHCEKGSLTIYRKGAQKQYLEITKDNTKTMISFERNESGYHLEAIEAQNCLRNGKKESSVWTLQDSTVLMSIMDEVRKQCGVFYKNDTSNIKK